MKVLHRKVPFYDQTTAQVIGKATVSALVRSASHILTEDPNLEIPGYRIKREFGPVRIWRREAEGPEIRKWRRYEPVVAWGMYPLMQKVDPRAATPPENWNIRYADTRTETGAVLGYCPAFRRRMTTPDRAGSGVKAWKLISGRCVG
ncbi:MAG: hypothetical protein OXC38_00065 [Gammaproteobacteria bacterium]|nr:hypothetical protein [Gammaproteobacteria bacterium]